jgi:hypothetical protein
MLFLLQTLCFLSLFKALCLARVSWLLKKNVVVKPSVVIIVKLHDTAHERVLGIARLRVIAIIVNLQRHHYRFLDEVSGVDHGVRVELLKILDLLNALDVDIRWLISFEVGVARAILNFVADFLAAHTAHLLHRLLIFVVVFIIARGFVLLALVLAKLAAGLVLAAFAAAPPHLATELRQVHPARPIVILLLSVLLGAILACFD